MPRSAPGGSPPKNTTLWIGRIARSLEPRVVRDLLEACGPIKEWKSATDPRTGALKGFAFCTFKDPEGVLVALEVLNGMVIDGQALALKCNSVTEQYLQWLKSTIVAATPAAEAADGAPAQSAQPDKDAAGGGKPKLSQEQLNSHLAAAREKIEALTADRPQTQLVDPTAAANEFLSSFGDGQPNQPLDRDSRGRSNDLRYREQQTVVEEGEIGYEPPAPPAVTQPALPPPPSLESGREKIATAAGTGEASLPQPPVSKEAELKHAAMLTKAPVITRKRPLTTAFNDEEEEDDTEKKTRKLIPIQYSAEELKAVHDESGVPGVGLPAVRVDPVEERRKQIMALVPKDQDGVFSYPVK